MTASNPCDLYRGNAAKNSDTFLSGSHSPESGYAHRWRVTGFASSNIAFAILLFNSRPSIRCPWNSRPLYVSSPLINQHSSLISMRVFPGKSSIPKQFGFDNMRLL